MRSPALRAAALLLAVAPLPAVAQGAPTHYTLAGDQIAVYDLAGTVKIVSGGGAAVTVDVQRGGRDAGKLAVQTGALRGRETLRVIFPDDDVIYPELGRGSSSDLRVRDDGTFSDGNGEGSGPGHRVRIRGDGDGTEAWADLTIAVPKGKRFALYIGAGSATVTNVDGDILVDAASASVTASGTRGALRLDTGSGEVKVSDADGAMDLDTGSGSVTLEKVRGPRLVVDAGSGRLRGTDIAVEEIELDLGSGGARLAGVRAKDVRLDSGSGSVDLGLLSSPGLLHVESGSGGITLRLPENVGAEVDIDTGSGAIESDLPIAVRRRSRSSLVGTIGDGKGRIEIEAGSGSVRLVKG